jgi:hypothetical protein
MTQKVVKRFIEKKLIYRYRLLERIVTNNAQNFNSKTLLTYVLNERSSI